MFKIQKAIAQNVAYLSKNYITKSQFVCFNAVVEGGS